VIVATFSGVNLLLGAWLAHRRKRADSERRRFYSQMRIKHGLAGEISHSADGPPKGNEH